MEQLVEVLDGGETIEFSVDIPDRDEFVACMQCGHRSYMHYWFMDDLMSYCKNHGERNQKNLVAAGGFLVFDNRDSLVENRLKGDN